MLSAPHDQVALEEIRQLQAIIARHEEHTFKIRGWLYTLLGALVVALLARQLQPEAFVVVGLVLLLSFVVMELLHRGVMRLAIDRVTAVEALMQGKAAREYDGPRVSESAGGVLTAWLCGKELFIRLVWVPYAFGLVVLYLGLVIPAGLLPGVK